jgi:phenylalanyl-tRNA synthetase alpha chain
VRAALGDRTDAVEAIEVLEETSGRELPPQAAEARPATGPEEPAPRVFLRHPTKTLTDPEANDLRDAVYAAVHEGTEWTRAVR